MFIKDPAAVLDYSQDWAEWLGTDTIAASTWTAPTGITVDDDDFSTTVATVWLSGGTLGATYALVNQIDTTAGRTDERTIYVRIRNR